MSSPEPDPKDIFAEALRLRNPAERAAFLDRVCAGKRALRQEVESLLAAYEKAGDFLDQACAGNPALRQEVESLLSAHERAGVFLQPTVVLPEPGIALERPGTMIGRYKLLEQIGEGGFGVVYMAEQTEPVQRKVALKIIKPGMDSRQIIARFEAERQALALMDHSNIAKVLDAGATEAGRPYFVMELVRGIPITNYCDQKALPMAERLQLFIQVCHAVQHAHQKAIIHRDLKPSNVLVTLHDGVPVPKVIDFGVAKALGQKLTEKTLFTSFAQMIGTPAYMSPEQAGLSGLDVDTRSDIYSLGVLLYELLTGVTPFDKETLAKAALDEIRRIIREVEPPKPSTRLHTLGNKLGEVAKQRQAEPATLSRLVRGDLDWIVMKCLEKDRTRRYETANNVAQDIEHHLNYEPVTAAAPSTVYLAQKFIRRHKAGLGMAATVVLLLTAGAVVSRLQAVRAQRAEKQAETVARMLTDILVGVTPELAKGKDTRLMLDVLGKVGARVDMDRKRQPLIAARMQDLLGVVYLNLGNCAKAESRLRWALETHERMLGKEHSATLTSLNHLARVLIAKGDYAGAERLYRDAKGAFERTLGKKNLTTIASQLGLGQALFGKGDSAGAEAVFREALDAQKVILGKDDPGTLKTISHLGDVLCARGNYAGAERLLRGALEEQEPSSREALRIVQKLAGVLGAKRDQAGAERFYRRALEGQEAILGKHDRDTLTTAYDLGRLLSTKGDYAGAERLFRHAAEGWQIVLGNESLNLACTLHNLGLALTEQGKLDEAEKALRESLAMHRKMGGAEHAHVPGAARGLAGVLEKRGKSQEAKLVNREAEATDSLIRALKSYGSEHAETAKALVRVGAAIEARGELLEAEPVYRRAYEMRLKLLDPKDPALTESRGKLIEVLMKTGRTAEAGAVERDAGGAESKR